MQLPDLRRSGATACCHWTCHQRAAKAQQCSRSSRRPGPGCLLRVPTHSWADSPAPPSAQAGEDAAPAAQNAPLHRLRGLQTALSSLGRFERLAMDFCPRTLK